MESRVKLIRKQLDMTQEQLAQYLGIGKAALSMIETGKTGLSTRNKNILIHDLNDNPDWLETGRGRMFNAEPDLTAYMHRTDNTLPLQSVPLYSVEGTAGLVPLFADQASAKPVNFIHIPKLDVPSAQKRRYSSLQAVGRCARRLLGRYVSVIDRYRRRGVYYGKVYPEIRS